jgi:hypothetical protein
MEWSRIIADNERITAEGLNLGPQPQQSSSELPSCTFGILRLDDGLYRSAWVLARKWDREFESGFLQRGVRCEPSFRIAEYLVRIAEYLVAAGIRGDRAIQAAFGGFPRPSRRGVPAMSTYV